MQRSLTAIGARGAALAAALALAAPAAAGPAQAAPPPHFYVSLGDSLAVGAQPDPQGRTRPTTQGYVDDIGMALGAGYPSIETVKLGCDGGTTASLISGPSCNPDYGPGSPLQQAEAFLEANSGQVALVTVDIGDNDVEQCLTSKAVDRPCVHQGWAAVKQNLPGIAERLRHAAGPAVPIVGISDYDQFLGYWLRGGSARSFALASIPVVTHLNRIMAGAYGSAGIASADSGPRFKTSDLTHLSSLPGVGRVPTAVERVCVWTWACSPPPVGFNDHANSTGYSVIAQTVLAVLARGRPRLTADRAGRPAADFGTSLSGRMEQDPETTTTNIPEPPDEPAAAETEERASAALYPERKVRAGATARPAPRRVPDGIDLADVEAAIIEDPDLREADRARLLGAARQLSDYHSKHRLA